MTPKDLTYENVAMLCLFIIGIIAFLGLVTLIEWIWNKWDQRHWKKPVQQWINEQHKP
jgi:hypothetical protein